MKRLICLFRGHKWNRDWRAINPETTFFARVDCTRCGIAIDGVALKRLSEAHPDLIERAGL